MTNSVISLNPRSPYFSSDVDLVLRKLREGFRAHSWTCWQASNRRDAVLCQDIPYDETRCTNARKLSQSSSRAFAILSGGYVSQASFHRNVDDVQGLCTQCNVFHLFSMNFGNAPTCLMQPIDLHFRNAYSNSDLVGLPQTKIPKLFWHGRCPSVHTS